MRLEQAELRVFHAVVEHGGFLKAANHLHLTQSAVSQSLKNLEVKLGLSLVTRSRPIQLTEAGRRVMQYANEVLRNEQTLLEDIQRISQGFLPVLSLAIDSTNNRFHAPHLLGEYCRSFPQTKLKVAEMPSREIVQAVLSGQVELGLGPFQTRMTAFESIPLYKENRLLLISPTHGRLDDILRAPESALHSEHLIVSSLDEPDQRPYMEKLRDQFQTVWEVTSLNLRLNLIDQGLAIGYISELILQQLPQYQHFIHLNQLSFGIIERQVGIYFKSGKQLSEGAIEFISICKDYNW